MVLKIIALHNSDCSVAIEWWRTFYNEPHLYVVGRMQFYECRCLCCTSKLTYVTVAAADALVYSARCDRLNSKDRSLRLINRLVLVLRPAFPQRAFRDGPSVTADPVYMLFRLIVHLHHRYLWTASSVIMMTVRFLNN